MIKFFVICVLLAIALIIIHYGVRSFHTGTPGQRDKAEFLLSGMAIIVAIITLFFSDIKSDANGNTTISVFNGSCVIGDNNNVGPTDPSKVTEPTDPSESTTIPTVTETVSMRTGLVSEDGKIYYANDDGSKKLNCWLKVDDNWYYFDSTGYAVTGWLELGSDWYYLDENCVMITGWHKYKNYWYYLYIDGNMAYSTVIEGYIIDQGGRCIRPVETAKEESDPIGGSAPQSDPPTQPPTQLPTQPPAPSTEPETSSDPKPLETPLYSGEEDWLSDDEIDTRFDELFDEACRLGDKGKYRESIDIYWEAVGYARRTWQSAMVFYNMGCMYMDLEDYEMAIVMYEQSLEIEDSDRWIYNNISVCYRMLGDDDQADYYNDVFESLK